MVLLARLAVDAKVHGRGVGAGLLSSALRKALAAEVAAVRLVVVDAIDDAAVTFYEHFDFRRTPEQHRRLYRRTKDIRAAYDAAEARRDPRPSQNSAGVIESELRRGLKCPRTAQISRAEKIRTSCLLIPSLDAMEPFDEVHRRSPHVLRDGAASLLIAQPCRSRRSLGHSSIRITALAAPLYVNIC